MLKAILMSKYLGGLLGNKQRENLLGKLELLELTEENPKAFPEEAS